MEGARGGGGDECTRRESNPQSFRRRNLNPVRMPVPPLVLGGRHSSSMGRSCASFQRSADTPGDGQGLSSRAFLTFSPSNTPGPRKIGSLERTCGATRPDRSWMGRIRARPGPRNVLGRRSLASGHRFARKVPHASLFRAQSAIVRKDARRPRGLGFDPGSPGAATKAGKLRNQLVDAGARRHARCKVPRRHAQRTDDSALG